MQIPVLRCNKGFTIIEFMISVFLLTVALFGLLTTLNLSMNTNMETKMRNDAAVLADEFISRARSVQYGDLGTLAGVTQRNALVGSTTVNYTITTTVNVVGGAGSNTSSLSVDVSWLSKGILKHHVITSSVTNPNN